MDDQAKDLYDTVQLEEKQFNKPHATKLYRQIIEEYPDSPYANQRRLDWPSWIKRLRGW
jgi:TolA-binding protein